MAKVIGDQDVSEEQKKIVSQWQDFSRTLAYKDLMSYIDDQRTMLIEMAEERAMPIGNGKKASIDTETANSLLQNSRGLNIVRTYIRLRSENM